jgi:hypothetical protein
MKNLNHIAAICAFSSMTAVASAQDAAPIVVPGAPAAQPAQSAAQSADTIILKRDTPVQLLATKEISTADVNTGSQFKLRINEPITVGARTIVPVGAWAIGEVTSATESGGLGKSGKMQARLLYIEMGNVRIPLQGDIAVKGQGAGSAGMAVLFSGAAGLFHRGNNAKIKAGELVHGFVAEDVTLDVSGGELRQVAKVN